MTGLPVPAPDVGPGVRVAATAHYRRVLPPPYLGTVVGGVLGYLRVRLDGEEGADLYHPDHWLPAPPDCAACRGDGDGPCGYPCPRCGGNGLEPVWCYTI